MTGFLVAGVLMAVLGVSLSTMLALANRKLYVSEDPRIEAVEALLPHANCGACGFPGCRGFAEALVAGKSSPSQCSASSPETVSQAAALLGVAAGTRMKQVARLACAGGANVARQRGQYRGLRTCRAAVLVAGGGKGCAWGCLGYGDCAEVCPFGAITMDANGLPVVDEDACTACGKCVEICPRNLFSVHDANHRLWVACNSRLQGRAAEAECAVACTGCGRCAMDAPGLIRIANNLATIDYTKNELASLDAIQRCPTGAIVWLDKEKGPIKGARAKRIELAPPASAAEQGA